MEKNLTPQPAGNGPARYWQLRMILEIAKFVLWFTWEVIKNTA
jgi:hypothetical protein